MSRNVLSESFLFSIAQKSEFLFTSSNLPKVPTVFTDGFSLFTLVLTLKKIIIYIYKILCWITSNSEQQALAFQFLNSKHLLWVRISQKIVYVINFCIKSYNSSAITNYLFIKEITKEIFFLNKRLYHSSNSPSDKGFSFQIFCKERRFRFFPY